MPITNSKLSNSRKIRRKRHSGKDTGGAAEETSKKDLSAGTRRIITSALPPLAAGALGQGSHFHEVQISFGSLQVFRIWLEELFEFKDKTYIADMAESIKLTGFLDPLNGFVHPSEVVSVSENHREGFGAHGLNSRYRAMMLRSRSTC